MLILSYNHDNSTLFGIQENQVVILASMQETIPNSISFKDKEKITYKKTLAAGIPTEYTDKGFLKGSIFTCTDCIIYSVYEAENFETLYVSVNEVKIKARDIWDNPSKYSKFEDKSEDAYHKFLKFIWIIYPNGIKKMIADLE